MVQQRLDILGHRRARSTAQLPSCPLQQSEVIFQRDRQQAQIGCAAAPARRETDFLILEVLRAQRQFPQPAVRSVRAARTLLLRQNPLVGRRVAGRPRRNGFSGLDRVEVDEPDKFTPSSTHMSARK
jgi:hypothetical protein